MKTFLTFLFGDIGLAISSMLLSVVSWFLFPWFVNLVNGVTVLSTIGAVFVGIFAVGFLASSLLTAFSLIFKSIRDRMWLLLSLSILALLSDVAVLIYSFI